MRRDDLRLGPDDEPVPGCGHGKQVPAEIYRSGPMRSLENAAADYACLINDVFSYQKEIEFEGEIHNVVLVVQNFLDCDYPTALRIVDDLMNSRMRQFEHIVEHELPGALRRLRPRRGGARGARRVRDGAARTGWPGILNWHRDCRRYGEEELRVLPGSNGRPVLPSRSGTGAPAAPAFLGGPTGLGTASLRPGRAAVRVPDAPSVPDAVPAAAAPRLGGPTGLGTSAARFPLVAGRA